MAFGNICTRWIYNHGPAVTRELMATVYSRGRSQAKYGPKFFETMADLERTERYDNERLQSLRDERLRRIVWYAYRYVPYYRMVLDDKSIHPMDIVSTKDLTRLPLLEKSVVQSRLPDFRSTLYSDDRLVERIQSSGTTGKALDVFVSRDYLPMEKAFTWHHRSWAGVKVGDKVASFVGFPVVPVSQKRPPFWVRDRVENRVIFSLQHMSQNNLPSYAQELARLRPVFIQGYPTAIYLMALYLLDGGEEVVRPKAVFTGSETLLPHQRKVIEAAFGCQVFDFYGSCEYSANIVQCEHGNYHIKTEYGVVEILNSDGTATAAGHAGELVCTGLNNLAMPFIRYQIGDTAVPKEGLCPCGRGGQLVERILGRVEDVVVTPDGRWISRLDFVFKGLANVEEAQLIQESRERLRVRLVKRPGYSEVDTRAILDNFRERLGPEVRIELEFVERIPRTSNGKFRYVISKVSIGLGAGAQTGDALGLTREEEATL